MARFVQTFEAAGNNYEALNEAIDFLNGHGFMCGPTQNGSPIGVMYGDVTVAKWRDLSAEDIADLHGRLESKGPSFSTGPITFRARPDAPSFVFEALADDRARQHVEGAAA